MEIYLEEISKQTNEDWRLTALPRDLINLAFKLRMNLANLREKYALAIYSKTLWELRDVDKKIFQATGTTFDLLRKRNQNLFFDLS